MMLESQGRICIGKDLAEQCNYQIGMKIRFVYEGKRTYRISPEILEGDKVAGSKMQIDEKYRIYIPKEIRDIYTSDVVVYGYPMEGVIYIEFLQTKAEKELTLAINRLAKAIEESH